MSQQLPTSPPPSRRAADRAGNDNLDNPGMNPVNGEGHGPGGGNVGVVGIVGLTIYLVLLTLFLIYGLVKVWPVPTPSREPATETVTAAASPSPAPTGNPSPAQASPSAAQSPSPSPSPKTAESAFQASPSPKPSVSPTASAGQEPAVIELVGWQFKLWDEQRLLLLVLFAGALGSILHALRSVYWYVGNRSLVRSWMVMYIVLPFAGATLALIFYLVVRGGFFSPQSSFKETSPFGFAAFAALIGMFSPQAVLKLKDVAEVMLSKPSVGANAKPQASMTPVVQTPPPPPPQSGGAPPPPPAGGNPPAQG